MAGMVGLEKETAICLRPRAKRSRPHPITDRPIGSAIEGMRPRHVA
jgi:hypothetical protein